MVINGKEISKEIETDLKDRVSRLKRPPMLVVFQLGDDPASNSFVSIKRKFAESIGVVFELAKFDESISTEDLIDKIETVGKDELVDGIVVQLPLPKTIDTDRVLKSIPEDKDVDALSGESTFSAPVVLALQEVLEREKVELKGKTILVIGEGRLVGAPIISWLKKNNLPFEVANDETKNLSEMTSPADIIFSGAGVPHLIKPEMIKDGVVLMDIGTSEEAGVLKGDIDPSCEEKAKFITPVPGGVGPIVVSKLFQNLVNSMEKKKGD